jgi:hypothetical protein
VSAILRLLASRCTAGAALSIRGRKIISSATSGAGCFALPFRQRRPLLSSPFPRAEPWSTIQRPGKPGSAPIAAVPNTPQVALEAGNSPHMIFGHYRDLVRARDAKNWFGITPESVETAKAARQSTGKKPSSVVALPKVVAA